mmetsp:Transcript_17837/g.51300  ORF Transcript_17837/g.51300 Transcript_17837/m.51300 type:complete len:263 (+) Transcript_17837:250-1038(+)
MHDAAAAVAVHAHYDAVAILALLDARAAPPLHPHALGDSSPGEARTTGGGGRRRGRRPEAAARRPRLSRRLPPGRGAHDGRRQGTVAEPRQGVEAEPQVGRQGRQQAVPEKRRWCGFGPLGLRAGCSLHGLASGAAAGGGRGGRERASRPDADDGRRSRNLSAMASFSESVHGSCHERGCDADDGRRDGDARRRHAVRHHAHRHARGHGRLRRDATGCDDRRWLSYCADVGAAVSAEARQEGAAAATPADGAAARSGAVRDG